MFFNLFPGRILFSVEKWKADLKREPALAKLLALRLFLIISLITAAIGTTLATFYHLQEAEARTFTTEYEAVVHSSTKLISQNFEGLHLGVKQLANIYSYNYPELKIWPNISWAGFDSTVDLIRRSSVIDGMGFTPLVLPEELPGY